MTIKCKAVKLRSATIQVTLMFNLLPKKNLFNLGCWIVSNLLVAIVTLSLVTGLNVTAETGLPNPTNENIEVFFDQPYKNFARCIKQIYFRDNQIDYERGTYIDVNYGAEYKKYKIDVFRQKCLDAGININVDLNNPSNVENFQKVAHCLHGIVFSNNTNNLTGWFQTRNDDRVISCIHVTQQTLGQSRQAYLDCIIREKYNPSSSYLDKNTNSLDSLCSSEKEEFSVFPRNISLNFDQFTKLMSCLDDNDRKPKFDDNTWIWEQSNQEYCRFTITELKIQMKTPSQLGISPLGGSGSTNVPNLSFDPIQINVRTDQTCWISKEGMNVGPNLTNIWNPGNWLPIMYQCQNTINGRPIPLHPINLIPIAIRLFAFITSLLIWLIVINIIVGIIMFIVGVAKSILTWVKNILIGSVAVVIVLILMYFILYLILSILQGSS